MNPTLQQKNQTLEDKILHCSKTVKIGDEVQVWRDGKVVHFGHVVDAGTTGAKVWNHRPLNGDTTPEHAQWYAYKEKAGGMVIVKTRSLFKT